MYIQEDHPGADACQGGGRAGATSEHWQKVAAVFRSLQVHLKVPSGPQVAPAGLRILIAVTDIKHPVIKHRAELAQFLPGRHIIFREE